MMTVGVTAVKWLMITMASLEFIGLANRNFYGLPLCQGVPERLRYTSGPTAVTRLPLVAVTFAWSAGATTLHFRAYGGDTATSGRSYFGMECRSEFVTLAGPRRCHG
ncbi:hypothetical protein J6590_040484 [Homalodisca vitripennis]|nr:hypothetical protein J6590_040484 [Homalodisca vitripennis]